MRERLSANQYHFITHWRVAATVQEVSDIIGDAVSLVHWWPSVYLSVTELQPGESSGVGRVIALHTKGWLPYTLKWQFRVTDARTPYGFSLEAWGDFEGRGVWTFQPDGEHVDITYDWKISAEKPLLRYLSFILKPVFAANHRWAMARGEESLKRELVRRRSQHDAQ